jgi:hypothetical protein
MATLLFGAAVLAGNSLPAASAIDEPVHVSSCDMAVNGQLSADAAFVTGRFVNEAKQSAATIDFTIWWGDGTLSTFRDAGSFTPGVAVTHSWNVPLGIREIRPRLWDDVRVSVERVTFADRTQWLAPYAHLSEDAAYAQYRPQALRCRINYG